MAVVNGLFWFTYCLLFVVFCLRKPNKNINYRLWLLLLSVLPVISIFRQGTYESGDLSLHATRLMAFWESISQGEIIPRWAGSLNAGFGYPLFQFIYPLPYYLASFWHWLGFGFINSIKVTIALAYILSGFTVYRLAKKNVSDLAAFAGAVLYLFAPYHLVDLHFRVAFGEIIAFVFLPLTMLCGYNYIDSRLRGNDNVRKTRQWLALSGLSFAGLIVSHPAISLISPIIILPYWWVNAKKLTWVNRLKIITTPLLLGLTLATFYLLPVFGENKYVWANYFAQGVEFERFSEYLFAPWRLGFLFQGPHGELSFLIGYVQIGLVLVAGLKLIKGKLGTHKRQAVLFCFLFFAFCFLLLPYSKCVWDSVPVFRNFRFTYRLLLPIALFTSLIGTLVVDQFAKHKKVIYLLLVITVSTTVLNWGNRRTIPQIDDNYLRIDLPYASARGEGMDSGAPKWLKVNDLWQKEPANTLIQNDPSLIDYQIITNLNRQKSMSITTNQPTAVKINIVYFPGWKVIVNGETKPILYEQKEHYGLVAFHVPEGKSQISLVFQDTLLRRLAGVISLLGGMITTTLLLRPTRGYKGN